MIDLNIFKEKDLYNLILYSIFRLTEDPKYSTISELIYSLDKENLLKLCSTFGGCVIKIPTLLELKIYTSALVIYQEININHKSFDEAFNLTNLDKLYKPEVADIYNKMIEVVEEYGK